MPSIGIVTPSFQQGAYLERTIRSVIDQQYPRITYVVQDGGSTDESVTILKKYDEKIDFWESRPDGGQAAAINQGMRRLDTDILAYLNSDDVFLPGALHCVGEYFARHPEVDVIYGDRVLIDETDRVINYWVLPPFDGAAIRWFDYIPQETLFWRRRAWEAVGSAFDERLQFAMDWDIILRFVSTRLRIHHITRFLGGFRVTETQKTNRMWECTGQHEAARIRRQALGFEPTDDQIAVAVRTYCRKQTRCERCFFIREWIGAQLPTNLV